MVKKKNEKVSHIFCRNCSIFHIRTLVQYSPVVTPCHDRHPDRSQSVFQPEKYRRIVVLYQNDVCSVYLWGFLCPMVSYYGHCNHSTGSSRVFGGHSPQTTPYQKQNFLTTGSFFIKIDDQGFTKSPSVPHEYQTLLRHPP